MKSGLFARLVRLRFSTLLFSNHKKITSLVKTIKSFDLYPPSHAIPHTYSRHLKMQVYTSLSEDEMQFPSPLGVLTSLTLGKCKLHWHYSFRKTASERKVSSASWWNLRLTAIAGATSATLRFRDATLCSPWYEEAWKTFQSVASYPKIHIPV